ncbi:hypothetical protein KK083_03395 [Fulvivirgaceae bacterium PWU4]|uniref:CHAT domain-containing protein n=1 Tax=Chryseosolibacter histidini TaxID=2782349 RepID=A0AAP2DGS2_9BACT|nr:hypothetical protein [Chryseosolibacter histidini]MBT1695906.1 hypothetical protein [Chryseosolibacter histidini]
MKRGIKFNAIFILQSLQDDERHTGSEIAQQIKYACLQRGIESMDELINVNDRTTFFEVINNITDSIAHGVKPYLHFEMHGTSSGGLCLSSGQTISWEELKEPLRKMNVACKNNLYVSLATCHGANFLDMYKGEIDKPCPFFGYIGASTKVDAFDFEVSFTSFFHAMLTKDSIANGIKSLLESLPDNRANYIFLDCEIYHKELMKNWEKEYGSLEGKTRYSKYLFQRAKKEYAHVGKSNRQMRRELDRMVFSGYTDDYLAQCKRIFLHETNG